MINFARPVRLRGIHAAYAQYLTTERGQNREGGVNVFQRIMDVYMYAIIIGLKYSKTADVDDSEIYSDSVFNNVKESDRKKISSSDIPMDTMNASGIQLNHIYKVVMLSESIRGLSDEEKIANAFKSDNNKEKVEKNLEFMNSLARGGLEILYERFQGLTSDEQILQAQLALIDSVHESIDEAENGE